MAKQKADAADAKAAPTTDDAPAGPVKAVVTVEGHGSEAVEVPADAADPKAAAVAAFKTKRGIWALPSGAEVEFTEG